MMAVVIILGIIAGMCMMMYNPNDEIKLAEAGQYLNSVIEYVRDEAIRRQTYTYAYINPSSDYIYCAYSSSSVWVALPHPLKTGNFTETLKTAINTNVNIANCNLDSTNPYHIIFNSFGEPIRWGTGTPILTTNYILLTSGDEHLYLTIKPVTGKVVTYR